MEFAIRQAVPGDAGDIDRLFDELMRALGHEDPGRGHKISYMDKFFSGGEDRIYVARGKDVVLAFLSVEVYRDGGYVYFDDLSVTEAHRGRGIGTALIRQAEAYVGLLGLPHIVFHVEKTNERAHRLYLRLGYRDDGEQGERIRMVKSVVRVSG